MFKVMPTAGYSLPELLEMASARIAGLSQGQAIVKIGIRPAAKIRTLRIKEGWASPEHIAHVKARIAANTPYIAAAGAEPSPSLLLPRKELPAPSEAEIDSTAPLTDGVTVDSALPLAPKLKDKGWG